MHGPPDPEMRSPATLASGRANSHPWRSHAEESDTSPLEYQAGKLSRIFYISLATALTIASLAYGGVR
jgi:hypothetical protein